MDFLWTPWRFQYVSSADKDSRQGVPAALAAWPGDEKCVFCNLIGATRYAVDHGMAQAEADRAAGIVYRGTAAFICLNLFPYASGHVMIVPFLHLDTLHALDQQAAHEMMNLTQTMDGILRQSYRPEGVNLGMNIGRSAGAGVAGHIHMHVLPRWTGDTNFMTVIGETRVLPETLEATYDRLSQALRLAV